MSPLRNVSREKTKSHRETYLSSEITGRTRRLVPEPNFLLTKQMYVLKCVQRLSFASSFTKTKKDVHYMFQTNSAVNQTEKLCRRSLENSEFLHEIRSMWPRVFSRPFSGLEVKSVNTHVLQKIPMCVIFFSIMLPFSMEFR